jgi:hypothetical protein|tara:strand:- start:343 stop:633 length:291 start_codon:yes stop_codon:yes gene_type:complete
MKEPHSFCPLIRKRCCKYDCAWYIKMSGTNPNTGADIDEWGCAVMWQPFLTLEASQQARQAGAAVESFRNETVNAHLQQMQLQQNQIIPAQIQALP